MWNLFMLKRMRLCLKLCKNKYNLIFINARYVFKCEKTYELPCCAIV